MTWSPALIMRKFHVSEAVAGLVIVIAGMIGVPAILYGGFLSDKWQQKYPGGRMRFATIMEIISATSLILSLVFIFLILYKIPGHENLCLAFGIIMFPGFAMTSSAGMAGIGATSQTVVSPDLKGMSWSIATLSLSLLGGVWHLRLRAICLIYLAVATEGLHVRLSLLHPLVLYHLPVGGSPQNTILMIHARWKA